MTDVPWNDDQYPASMKDLPPHVRLKVIEINVKHAVKASQRNGSEAMVEGGLRPGERVVVYPSDALRDGARIHAR